jgi:pimeloyl-ACP methyl ester carboxylesterase
MLPTLPNIARTLAATCALIVGGLALSTSAQAAAPCPDGARCGTVTVPLDRTHPAADTIDIAYAVLPRTDTSRPALSTIVPNPGGPGSGPIAEADAWAEQLAPLRRRRDILLIDPRGTGRSGALACPSMASENVLTLDLAGIARTCGADLAGRARFYGAADVADDFDAVRAALGVQKVDLWGQSYGTFLMPVYAARHPERVRSIVLSGAYPISFDMWGRDLLRGARRSIGLVCERAGSCSGRHVFRGIGRLAKRLRRHPVPFTAQLPDGPLPLTLGERELAAVTYGRGLPQLYGPLPAAIDAALDHDYALLKRLATMLRLWEISIMTADPVDLSFGELTATTCHDYPQPFDLADPPAERRADYDRALAAVGKSAFAPFSPGAWFQSGIWAGPVCLNWPTDPTAGSPLQGRPLPDVPVLVQSGDLDTSTPIEQGRGAAAQFPHATFAVIANAGHTPDTSPCGAAMAIDFVRHLHINPARCRHAGSPPAVADRPARRAAGLPSAPVHASAPVRRAVTVALATIADARSVDWFARLAGVAGALRGGSYVPTEHGVRFDAARVVTDAVASGEQKIGRHTTRTSLRLRGRGVPRAQLTLRSAGRTTRITGTVAGRRVALTVAAAD